MLSESPFLLLNTLALHLQVPLLVNRTRERTTLTLLILKPSSLPIRHLVPTGQSAFATQVGWKPTIIFAAAQIPNGDPAHGYRTKFPHVPPPEALSVRQEEVQRQESGYLGGVAVAPNTHIYDAIIQGLNMTLDLSGEELQDYGSATTFPSDLAKRGIELGKRAQLCAAALPAVVHDLNSSQLISTHNLTALSTIKEFQDLKTPAQGAQTTHLLLVIVGANDATVFPGITRRAYKWCCEAGNALYLSVYPELEHSAPFGSSAPEWLGSISGLFSGRGRGLGNCSMETGRPLM
ncbi:uncharacterized protein BDV17DRAFT_289957 [Aspergillus undulatus]|uniref:uncharacterized protein n=1 Tax=Aspergillus undulatus TaxID=1810928 RepID=UPI003CCD8913